MIASLALAAQLQAQVRTLLNDYSGKDVRGIMSMLDDDDVLMMGTALPVVASSREQVRALLENDFSGWDTSRFGNPQNYRVSTSGDTASIFFDVPWKETTHGATRSYTIRLATVWHKRDGVWRLAQILSSVVQ